MNDAEKIVNLLERIEFLLEAVYGELKFARLLRAEATSMDQHDVLQEIGASLAALDTKRREMRDPEV